jgi:hypothetical protein
MIQMDHGPVHFRMLSKLKQSIGEVLAIILRNKAKREKEKQQSNQDAITSPENGTNGANVDKNNEVLSPLRERLRVIVMMHYLRRAEAHPFLIQSQLEEYLSEEDVDDLLELAKEHEGPEREDENMKLILEIRKQLAEMALGSMTEVRENESQQSENQIEPYFVTDDDSGSSHGMCLVQYVGIFH